MRFAVWLAVIMVPMIVAMAGLVVFIAKEHREAVDIRHIERMRAMSIAVDTELEGTIRVLRALALAPELDMHRVDPFIERMRRYQSTQPLWTVIALGDPQWKQVTALDRKGNATARPAIEPRALMHIAQTQKPSVSPLIRTDERHFETQVTVPVTRNGAMVGILLVSIDPRAWLELLGEYPAAPGATMTLLDQDGAIIARTLNHETWVGTRPEGTMRPAWREKPEAARRSTGLEGQAFYSAYSRSRRTGWTVAMGVPAEAVEEGAMRKLLISSGVAIVALGLTVLLAFHFGRRI